MIPLQAERDLHVRIVDRAEDGVEGATGMCVNILGPSFLPRTGADLDSYACWDLAPGPYKEREACARIGRGCEFAGFAWLGLEPLAMAWINPIGSGCGEAHFLCRQRRPQAVYRAVRLFMAKVAGRFSSLICLVPRPFWGAHKLVLALGFRRLARLKGACLWKARGTVQDGTLYLWEKGEGQA